MLQHVKTMSSAVVMDSAYPKHADVTGEETAVMAVTRRDAVCVSFFFFSCFQLLVHRYS